jgi:serine/threonine protein kinase
MEIFSKMNASLEKLLANAILPMNAMNVFHLDLKASNMMIDDKYNVKIVDWGLSTVITDFDVIPREFRRPLHFNMPYSIIILNKDFLNFIDKTLQSTQNITVEILIPRLTQFYVKFAETYGSGHEDRINDILHNLMSSRRHRHNEVIMRYIAEIIVEFREADNTFNVTKYFKEVFLKNVDIWGFFHAYFPVMNLDTPRKQSYSQRAEIFISDRFKELYTLFLLKYSAKPIPVLEFRDWVIRIQKTSKGPISNVKTFSFELDSVVPLVGSKDLNLKKFDKVKRDKGKVKKNKVTKKRKRRKRSSTNDMSKTRKKIKK